jgi:hypothetical protein
MSGIWNYLEGHTEIPQLLRGKTELDLPFQKEQWPVVVSRVGSMVRKLPHISVNSLKYL